MKKSGSYNTRKNRMFPKKLGDTVAKLTKPIMKKHGLPDGLVSQWPSIAGEELAGYTLPVACKRAKNAAASTLILEVAPSHALIAQHSSGIILEKINLHYGYRLIERVQFKPMTSTPDLIEPVEQSHHTNLTKDFDQLIASLNTPKTKD